MAKDQHEHSQRLPRLPSVCERGNADSDKGASNQGASAVRGTEAASAEANGAAKAGTAEATGLAESPAVLNPRDQSTQTLPVRKQLVYAGPCQRVLGPGATPHKHTRVTSTQGKIRYCICDDCGEKWKKVGPVVGEAQLGVDLEVSKKGTNVR